MKLMLDVADSDVITISEIVRKLGLEKFCQGPAGTDPRSFRFEDENGKGTFDVATGEVKYENGEVYDYYERELGCFCLCEALDFANLIWAKTEDGETVAYCE